MRSWNSGKYQQTSVHHRIHPRRNSVAKPSITNSSARVPPSRKRLRKLEPDAFSSRPLSQNGGRGWRRQRIQGSRRAGWRAGHSQAGGRAAEMGSSEKVCFNQSTETTSVLEPSWRWRNYLNVLELDKVQGTKVPEKKQRHPHVQCTKTKFATNKAGGS